MAEGVGETHMHTAVNCMTARGAASRRARDTVEGILVAAQRAQQEGATLSHFAPSAMALHGSEAWSRFTGALMRAFRAVSGGTLSITVESGFIMIAAT